LFEKSDTQALNFTSLSAIHPLIKIGGLLAQSTNPNCLGSIFDDDVLNLMSKKNI
jgi:hypothetical protein